jgi:hypothetical protein
MRTPTHQLRVLVAALATFQAAAPPAAALADALSALDARWIGQRPDDEGSRHETPPHRHDCIFCQFLGHPALAAARPVQVRTSVFVVDVGFASPHCTCRQVLPDLPDSRAPPVA